MKLHFRGNKFIEIFIYSIAIGIAIILLIIFNHSFWYVLPYFLIEIIVLYLLLTFQYVVNNQFIKVRYGFFTFKAVNINRIYKIIIHDKQKGESKNTPHRIEIQYEKIKKIIVSPKETVGFIENIERINPRIEII